MIVRCPRCSARYRVREEKLPPGGGNIQCPGCGNIFSAAPDPTASTGPKTPLPVAPPYSSAITENTAVTSRARFAPQDSDAYITLESPPRPPPEEPLPVPATPRAAAPAPTGADQWKIKTSVGLVYDFPYLDALRTWLANRDNVEGMQASRDGGSSWHRMEIFNELSDVLPRGARTGRPPAPGAEINRPPTRLRAAVPGPGPTMALQELEPMPVAAVAKPMPMPELAPRPRTGVFAAPGPRVGATEVERAALGGAPRFDSPRGVTPGPAAPNPTLTVSSVREGRAPIRPHSATLSDRHPAAGSGSFRAASRRTAETRRAGTGTYVGLFLVSLIIAGTLVQVLGVFDIFGALGLRSEPQPPPATAPLATDQPSDDDESSTLGEQTVRDDDRQEETGPQNDQERGLDLLEERRTQRSHPLRPQIEALLGQARQSQADGRLDEALAFVNDARRLDQNDPDVVCLLAEIYREMGSLSQADTYQSECSSARADADQSSETEIGAP